jgi:hypothetical protein
LVLGQWITNGNFHGPPFVDFFFVPKESTIDALPDSAVGSLSGMGYPQYSVLTALAILLTNITLRPLTYKLRPSSRRPTIASNWSVAPKTKATCASCCCV